MLIGGQHCQDYSFPTAMPSGVLPSVSDSLMAWSCCPKVIFSKAKVVMWCWVELGRLVACTTNRYILQVLYEDVLTLKQSDAHS
jgi:hypothetical protein